jgi:hypothetical protein
MFMKFFVIFLFVVILNFNDPFSAPHYEMGDSNISTNTNWLEGEYSMNSLIVSNGATLTIDGGSTISVTGTLHIEGNSKIVLKSKDTAGQIDGEWQGSGVLINAGNITIESGSKISAGGQGYLGGPGCGAPGQGPGGGNAASCYAYGGGGGAYAGAGGAGSAGGAAQTNTYGSDIQPTDLGSGGGGGNGGIGGAGGGAIRLVITNTLRLNGSITANGGNGTDRGGGGSGGSIYVTTGVLAGSGTFSANGGNGISYGGGGGGGRIAIFYSNVMSLPTGNITANGSGSGTNAGYPGTIVIHTTPPGSPSSLISIQDIWTNVDSFDVTWNNSTEPSGIVAAWYKIGSPPTSNDDGTRVLGNNIQGLDNLIVPAEAEGEIVVYVWLEDALGNEPTPWA